MVVPEEMTEENLTQLPRREPQRGSAGNTAQGPSEPAQGPSEPGPLSDIDNEICQVCRGHGLSLEMSTECCGLRCCEDCRKNEPMCPQCLLFIPAQENTAAQQTPQGLLTVLLDLNGVLECEPRGHQQCLDCPLSKRFCPPSEADPKTEHDPSSSMLAHCVPLEAPFAQCRFDPVRKDAGYNGIPSWLYVRPGAMSLIEFLRTEERLQWGIFSTMTAKNALASFKALMNHLGFEVTTTLDEHRLGELLFFTQEDCEPDDHILYPNGNKGCLPSPDVIAKVLGAEPSEPGVVVFVLPNSRKSRLVHSHTLLVPDYRREKFQTMQDEQWVQDIQCVFLEIMSNPERAKELLRKQNRCFVEVNRAGVLLGPVLDTVSAFLAEPELRREGQSAVLREWPMLFSFAFKLRNIELNNMSGTCEARTLVWGDALPEDPWPGRHELHGLLLAYQPRAREDQTFLKEELLPHFDAVSEPISDLCTLFTCKRRDTDAMNHQCQKTRAADVSLQTNPVCLKYRENHFNASQWAADSFQPSEEAEWVATKWEGFVRPTDVSNSHPTGVDIELLRKIGERLCYTPEGFKAHAGLKRQLKKKMEDIENGETIDWATAEALAFGTLLLEGNHVRSLSENIWGQY
eukprot:s2528_g28.t1